jgi:hypothetical protein
MSLISCLCGDVRVELAGDPIAQCYCHCDDCQRAHMAAFVPVAIYPVHAVKVVSGDPVSWNVERTPRTSCARCGTRIFAEPPGVGIRGVMALLLPPGSFKPAFHMQCQHAVLPIRDDLPHFKGFPAAFGGSDEKVDW